MIAGRRLDRMPTVLAVEDLGGAETADDQSDENAEDSSGERRGE